MTVTSRCATAPFSRCPWQGRPAYQSLPFPGWQIQPACMQRHQGDGATELTQISSSLAPPEGAATGSTPMSASSALLSSLPQLYGLSVRGHTPLRPPWRSLVSCTEGATGSTCRVPVREPVMSLVHDRHRRTFWHTPIAGSEERRPVTVPAGRAREPGVESGVRSVSNPFSGALTSPTSVS